MEDHDLIAYLRKEKLKLEKELRKYREKDLIIHCEECDTYHFDLEGARDPDYEGYCPKCGEESNWAVESILDKRDDIKDWLNNI